ncbi:hypothetical protein T265_04787 [Opisthorchis viverrini]|uniref:RRM domain-containing protein n=1 Tax=Opisthorchis viverrini TaxID=6198 RepID=A0A074ZMK0_OPIVI|nr:hypothetical protein T265_04787 [Opisthorchis viverrini]KER28326.1 hypothetical protein T265_04787 [Opisthorchis viverrini]
MSRVYIGHLPARCSERDIERFFKGYGRLRDVVLKNGYGFVEFDNEKDADDAVYDLHGRELRGERIIVEHARLPPGSRGGSRRSGGGRDRYGPPTRTEYRVVVENLSSRVITERSLVSVGVGRVGGPVSLSWSLEVVLGAHRSTVVRPELWSVTWFEVVASPKREDLKDLMRKAGDVTYADAHKSARNDGIVEFSQYADMKEAIEKFDGYELYGRKLRVYEDRPNRRSRSRSRNRSRSGSRTRKYSNRSRSRESPRLDRTRSPRRRRERTGSSEGNRSPSHGRRDSHKRSRELSGDARSRSVSHHSGSRHSRERSISHRSEKHSLGHESRSPSRNGRDMSAKNGSERRSRSRSASLSRSRSRSRSPASRSPERSRSASRSRSRSGSRRSRSGSERPHSDEEMDNSRQSDGEEHGSGN